MDEEVESRSDGVHRIHWTLIDSNGKVHFSIRERLRKIPLLLYEGVKRRSSIDLGLKERVMLHVQCAFFDSWHD